MRGVCMVSVRCTCIWCVHAPAQNACAALRAVDHNCAGCALIGGGRTSMPSTWGASLQHRPGVQVCNSPTSPYAPASQHVTQACCASLVQPPSCTPPPALRPSPSPTPSTAHAPNTCKPPGHAPHSLLSRVLTSGVHSNMNHKRTPTRPQTQPTHLVAQSAPHWLEQDCAALDVPHKKLHCAQRHDVGQPHALLFRHASLCGPAQQPLVCTELCALIDERRIAHSFWCTRETCTAVGVHKVAHSCWNARETCSHIGMHGMRAHPLMCTDACTAVDVHRMRAPILVCTQTLKALYNMRARALG